ncbi:MAG: dGTP triphosphohydrolase [Nitrobacter sp.]
MTRALYRASDWQREAADRRADPWRHDVTRDYGRIIHSASFRRLQGKTQVFPGHESDFFRNRLTHSLEVAQIAEGIADRLNHVEPALKSIPINGRLCAVAALVHDLGHPPFGHNGERALDDAMRKFGGFEGNAQTLRILSRLEKKVGSDDDKCYGLNLTYRTLAAILKYDKRIPVKRNKQAKLQKGYYDTEKDLVKSIKASVAPNWQPRDGEFKTIECSIMDLADDIAYSTFDLEDSLKAEFLSPAGMLSSDAGLLDSVARKVSEALDEQVEATDILEAFTEIFSSLSVEEQDEPLAALTAGYAASKALATSGYLRTQLSSQLIGEAITEVTFDFNSETPPLSRVSLSAKVKKRVEILKQYTFQATIYSSKVTLGEYRGYEIVSGIFKALASPRGYLLMPDDVRAKFQSCDRSEDKKMRVVCDFVAGMTDRYAVEFYGRLHSDTAQSMFKPI